MNKKKSMAPSVLLQVSVFVFLCGLMALTGCNPKHSDPSPNEVARQRLMSSTWQLDNLAIDNVDQTNQFAGLTLSFTASNYSTTNGKDPVWPSNGTWAFKGDTGKSILRDGSLNVTLIELTPDKLVLSYSMTTSYNGGRVGAIGGNYLFTFKK